MNRFWGLLKKDLIINRNTLLVPVWIALASYLIAVITIIAAYVRNDININLAEIPTELTSESIGYLIHNFTVVFQGTIAILIIIGLAGSALNGDSKSKCEVFYRTQPLSVWSIALSKYISSIFAALAVAFLIMLFNYAVTTGLFSFYIDISWSYGFLGLLQNFLNFSIAGILVGGFAFLCSGIFKDKAFLKGFMVILLIGVFTALVNYIFGWKIPSLFAMIAKFIFSGVQAMEALNQMNDTNFIYVLINENWKQIFGFESLLKILFSGLFFVVGTFLYKKKEI